MADSKKITGTTKSGFKFCINKDVWDDMELLEELEEIAKGNILVLPKVCERTLGKAQKENLYNHVRDEAGKVSANTVCDTLNEIMLLANAKNC